MDRGARIEAEAPAFELDAGIAKVDQAKDWAYGQVAAVDRPAGPLLELLEVRLHPTDAARHLHELPGSPRDADVLRHILRRLGSALRADRHCWKRPEWRSSCAIAR